MSDIREVVVHDLLLLFRLHSSRSK